MTDLRDFTLENVLSALLDELPHADRGELRERAMGFIAVAENAHVPIEQLLGWIHASADEKEYSLREFRGYCHAITAARRPESLFGADTSDIRAFD